MKALFLKSLTRLIFIKLNYIFILFYNKENSFYIIDIIFDNLINENRNRRNIIFVNFIFINENHRYVKLN